MHFVKFLPRYLQQSVMKMQNLMKNFSPSLLEKFLCRDIPVFVGSVMKGISVFQNYVIVRIEWLEGA